MQTASHHRAFSVTVVWTLGLLFLGSVVHATESSLACPDWPTCFGTMVPEMEGGVFWEHLHRLVAGGLLILFGAATWLAARQARRGWIFPTALAGVALLIVQSVFGGLTVIYRLPDAVSTTHLALALVFLSLAVVLATVSAADAGGARPGRPAAGETDPGLRAWMVLGGGGAALLVFLQSVLGGAVRHADAGMACGRGILCNGSLLPAGWSAAVALQWSHRILGVVVALAVLGLAAGLLRRGAPRPIRRAAWLAATLVVAQVAVGFLSAWTILAVAPVSLHTLVAASLLAVCVWIWTRGSFVEGGEAPVPDRSAAAAAAA